MTTAFSYDIFAAQRAGGVTRCVLELMRALPAAAWRAWAGTSDNAMLAEAVAEGWLDRARIEGWTTARAPGRIAGGLRQEPAFARWLARSDARVVHRTYYPIIDLAPRRLRRVVTVHDMWDERADPGNDRGAWLRSRIKRRAAFAADIVICVSEATRAEMLHFWPALEGRCRVIPHGVRRLSDVARLANIDRPYFLFVGRRSLYKNFRVIVEALRFIGRADHQLICFGGGAFTAEERDHIARSGLTGRVKQVDGDDARLAGLYEAATALVYPSAYEGFGLPLLEAMIHDCPVLASPAASLPEVGGKAALYAAPDAVDEWAAGMVRIADDAEFADTLRRSGRRRVALFSWERAAQAHLAAYRELQGAGT